MNAVVANVGALLAALEDHVQQSDTPSRLDLCFGVAVGQSLGGLLAMGKAVVVTVIDVTRDPTVIFLITALIIVCWFDEIRVLLRRSLWKSPNVQEQGEWWTLIEDRPVNGGTAWLVRSAEGRWGVYTIWDEGRPSHIAWHISEKSARDALEGRAPTPN